VTLIESFMSASYAVEVEPEETSTLLKPETKSWSGQLSDYGHLLASLAVYLAVDACLHKLIHSAVPSGLVGMFAVFFSLSTLSELGQERLVNIIIEALRPATTFIARFLPIFYSPCLVVVPLVVSSSGFRSLDYAKLGLVLLCGVPFSLFFTAAVVSTVRAVAKVQPLQVEHISNVSPCSSLHAIFIGGAAFAGLCGSILRGAPQDVAETIFLVAATASGMLLEAAPTSVNMIIPHPVILCMVNGIAGCGFLAAVTGRSFMQVQESYLRHTRSVAEMGAGDLLLLGLGPVLLSFGIHMYHERLHLRRHWLELLVGAALASFASLIVTTYAGYMLGLPASLSLALSPRSITLPLAIPMAKHLGVPNDLLPVTGACATLTALLGGVMLMQLLKIGGIKDPVVRGFSAGSAALGMGPATLAKAEASSLPFAALGYGLVGIAGSMWVEAVPGIVGLIRMISGN